MSKKGALSMALDPSLPETQEYRARMGALADSLMPDEEEDRSERLMAFGAGLSSPGDQGGALSRALGAELKQRNEAKLLKSQYVPMVMTALANQAQAAQASKMNALIGSLDFNNMSPEQIAAVETATGAKLKDLWEMSRFGKQQAPGSFAQMPDGRRIHYPDVKAGVTIDENNRAAPIPGLAQINAQGKALEDYYSGVAKAQSEGQSVFQGNAPGVVPKAQALGLPPGPPIVPGGGIDQPQGGPPMAPGVGQPPAIGQPPASPVQAPPAGAAPAGVPGRPRVAPADQNIRDNDAAAILQQEMNKTLQMRQEAIMALEQAQRSGDPRKVMEAKAMVQRADGDVAALSREIQRMGGKPPASLTPPPVAATATPAPTKPAGGAGFVQTGPSGEQTAANEALGALNKDWISGSYRPVQDEAANAGKVLNGVSVMRTALAGIGDNGTGWGAEQKKKATQIAAALGIKNAKEVAGNYEIFNSQVGQHLFDLLGAQKGPQTEGDADRAKETLVSLGKTRKANEFLIDLAQATAERNMKRASFYREMMPIAQKSGNLSAVDQDWAEVAPSVFDSPVMRRWKVKKQ